MRRLTAATLAAATLFLAACGGRPGGRGEVRPAPTAARTARPLRVAVVDIDAVARRHPRWPALDALNRRLQAVEVALLSPPPPPPLDQRRAEAQLAAQARQIRAAFEAELQAQRQRDQVLLDRYARQVQEERRARLQASQRQIEAEVRRAVEARAAALQEALRAYELQVIEEYRYPLANLRLKADVVGIANEEELRRLNEELARLQAERDARIRQRAAELDQQLAEFQRAQEQLARARLERLARQADAEVRTLVEAKRRELEARAAQRARAQQARFQARVEAVRRQILGALRRQVEEAQQRYLAQLRERERQLQAERQALQAQRLRLQDSLLAEVKIEVAALAAEQGLDVVLTRYISNVTSLDLTDAVIARLK